eukprot:TRINITY_DN9183_c0_g1_i2.p1 TRINITY_DN9183_c0_g1~~TRINITY_DN9183_c0_g1_i2.p1  ORF type:complete len:149 (+),score=8.95 TRINITY_DN9183_c0_g1_i2:91-537(+)
MAAIRKASTSQEEVLFSSEPPIILKDDIDQVPKGNYWLLDTQSRENYDYHPIMPKRKFETLIAGGLLRRMVTPANVTSINNDSSHNGLLFQYDVLQQYLHKTDQLIGELEMKSTQINQLSSQISDINTTVTSLSNIVGVLVGDKEGKR